ncbi:MAG: hypothetical protein LBT04_09185 [Prevotellaceae bacterium]|jgi:hypothetical protein|nr:hypothetical protein [Prevotellaceae bacterium]
MLVSTNQNLVDVSHYSIGLEYIFIDMKILRIFKPSKHWKKTNTGVSDDTTRALEKN